MHPTRRGVHYLVERRRKGWIHKTVCFICNMNLHHIFLLFFSTSVDNVATGFSFTSNAHHHHASSSSSFIGGIGIGDSSLPPHRIRGDATSTSTSSLFATNKSSGGGSNSNINNGGKTLTTKQILNPEIYLSRQSSPPLLTPPENHENDAAVPLFAGLRLLIQSLETILDAASSSDQDDDDESSIVLNHLDSTTILRIEQPISAVHSVDPLCWLHAQQRRIDNLRRSLQEATSNGGGGEQLPVIYFSDAEGHVEAAAVGKASPVYSDSWDPFMGKRIWDDVNASEKWRR